MFEFAGPGGELAGLARSLVRMHHAFDLPNNKG
jgi:hypothetical protein